MKLPLHSCLCVCVCYALLFNGVAHTLSFNEPSAQMLNLFGIASPNTSHLYQLPSCKTRQKLLKLMSVSAGQVKCIICFDDSLTQLITIWLQKTLATRKVWATELYRTLKTVLLVHYVSCL
ncbi:hypothetical protein OIU78_026565 [Salix suchowensis]|nr:hypothetical protein OIU78_026565 [Salix suchowensis]